MEIAEVQYSACDFGRRGCYRPYKFFAVSYD